MLKSSDIIIGEVEKLKHDKLVQRFQYSQDLGLVYGGIHDPSKTLQGECLFIECNE